MAESVLLPLGLTAAAAAIYAAIHKKMFGSGCPSELALTIKTLIIWNKEVNDTMKIVKSLE